MAEQQPGHPDPKSFHSSVLSQADGSGNGRKRPGPSSCSKRRRDWFGQFAAWASLIAGSRWAFLVAALSVLLWGVTGPFFHYSETWQLVINTGTTIITFLMVFLIQNSQNRESKAVQLKLDELIHAVRQADNRLIRVEDLTDEQLEELAAQYRRLAQLSNPEARSDEEDTTAASQPVGTGAGS